MFSILYLCAYANSGRAYIKATDVIFDDNENTIYMIGWVYSRITKEQVSNRFAIYQIELNTNSMKLFLNNTNVDRLKLSPNNEMFAVIRNNTYQNNNKELLIYNIKDKKLLSRVVDDIITYEWSPDNKEIVYIKGNVVEREGIQSSGVFLFDIESNKNRKISDGAKDLEWHYKKDIFLINSSFIDYSIDDNRTIIGNTEIFDYSENKIVKSNMPGIQFSLDGKYSLKLSQANIGRVPGAIDRKNDILLDIYDIEKGITLQKEKLNKIYSNPSDILWSKLFWASNDRLIIVSDIVNTLDNNIKICDFINDNVIEKRVGKIVGTNSGRSKIIIYYQGRFFAVNIP